MWAKRSGDSGSWASASEKHKRTVRLRGNTCFCPGQKAWFVSLAETDAAARAVAFRGAAGWAGGHVH